MEKYIFEKYPASTMFLGDGSCLHLLSIFHNKTLFIEKREAES